MKSQAYAKVRLNTLLSQSKLNDWDPLGFTIKRLEMLRFLKILEIDLDF
jgi:hypothetical protein